LNNSGELLEVHLSGMAPSSLVSSWRFGMYDDDSNPSTGRYYLTSGNLPWALLIPVDWEHVLERVDISNGYPHILIWAASGGASNTDWYLTRRVKVFIFADVPEIGSD